MKKHYLYTLLSLATLSLYSSYTLAACVQNPSASNINRTVPGATYNIQYDDMAVRELGTLSVLWSSGGVNTLMTNTVDCGNAMMYGRFINNWSPNAASIAPSNIPGIGIKAVTAGIPSFNTNWGPNTNGNWYIAATTWNVTIVKTGQVTTSNTLRSGQLAQLTQYNPKPNATFTITTVSLPSTIKINVLRCSTKQSSYSVNLGDWYNTQFKNIGDSSDSVNIPVTLSCLQGTNIKVTITSTSTADAATGKINPSGANSAKGVAIQLLDKNNNPIKLNTSIQLATRAGAGDYIFGWKARYIKTANEITPGPANASATVNILYQ